MSDLDWDQLLNDVNSMGYSFPDVNDLLRIGPKDRVVIPVFLRHLRAISNQRHKEFLVRCLGVKGFKEVTPILLEEFYTATGDSYKWAIGNSLEIISDKSTLPELVKIAKNEAHGSSRQMIVMAIGKLGGKNEVPVLVDLLQDKEVQGHTVSAIGRIKDPTLIPYVEPFLGHEKTWIRNKAKQVINKLQKIQEKQSQTKQDQ